MFGCTAQGITLSPVQAARANELSAAAGLGEKCSFQVADALNQPFADSTFDLVWSMVSRAVLLCVYCLCSGCAGRWFARFSNGVFLAGLRTGAPVVVWMQKKDCSPAHAAPRSVLRVNV